MSAGATAFRSFVRALHRRALVLRVLESAAVGLACGAGVALVLLPLLLWRGRPALPVALVALGVGAAAGFVSGLLRRPGMLEATLEADRQLRLADLLSTAWAILTARETDSIGRVEAWNRTVLAMAEARCRQLSPSAVVLHRLGTRAWGGVGLASALALTLAALTTRSDVARASRPQESARVQVPALPPMPPSSALTSSDANSGRARPDSSARAQDDVSSRAGVEETVRPDAPDVPDAGSLEGASAGTGQSAGDATGGGVGRSDMRPTDPSNASPDSSDGLPPDRASRPGDTNTGGAGTGAGATAARPPAATGSDGEGGATSSGHDSSDNVRAAEPWRSADWSSDARRAREAVDAGRVPAAYRDLVKEFFEPVPPASLR